ncbi:MAG: COX15/CtaA family protein [Ardenticatenaceae bacterium]|nr:COX15/CtaA family protein [Ardenticatenaceae bacterium]
MFNSLLDRVPSKNLARYVWILVIYTLLVILWGAYVRATGSGAGCGSHWPTCNGDVIPRPEQIETIIEFTHRVTSAIMGPMAIALIAWSWRVYGRTHRVTKGSAWTFFFILVEGGLGAGLVLLELVADNDSSARALAMALHLINTLLLLGVMTLTAWWASGGRPIRLKGQRELITILSIALIGLMVVGAFGAITALGDTLFPAETFAEGAAAKFDPDSHFSVRARLYHPLIAVGVSIYIVVALWTTEAFTANPGRKTLTYFSIGMIGIQLLGGVVNVLLAAPVWMQLVHLLLADISWIGLICLGAAVLEVQREPVPEIRPNIRSTPVISNN